MSGNFQSDGQLSMYCDIDEDGNDDGDDEDDDDDDGDCDYDAREDHDDHVILLSQC